MEVSGVRPAGAAVPGAARRAARERPFRRPVRSVERRRQQVDPIAFLDRIKHRVVTVHASDRFVAPGATLDELRSHDGTIGYPDRLIHGETGRGANDYDGSSVC